MVSFALAPRDQKLLSDEFLAVSMPTSARYGNFLSFEETRTLTHNAEAADATSRWLTAECGASDVDVSPGGDWIEASLTVAQAARKAAKIVYDAAT